MNFIFKPQLWLPFAFFLAIAAYFLIHSMQFSAEEGTFHPVSTARSVSEPTGKLHIMNWEDYFAEDTLPEFKRLTGVNVVLSTFADEDEMVSSVLSNPERYDIIVTSQDRLMDMARTRLLRPINHRNMPNFRHCESVFLPAIVTAEGQFGIPYLWGTTGIIVNTEHIPEYEESWNLLNNPAYAGKLTMLNSKEEAFSTALKVLGHSLNSMDRDANLAAAAWLEQQRPRLHGYLDPVEISDKMRSGEIWAAHCYSGDALTIVKDLPNCRYFLPREGFAFWVDYLCIPRDAQNVYEAERFINYMLTPEVIAKVTNELHYPNCNAAARALVDRELLDSPLVYPTPETLQAAEQLNSRHSESESVATIQAIRNRCWSRLLASE